MTKQKILDISDKRKRERERKWTSKEANRLT